MAAPTTEQIEAELLKIGPRGKKRAEKKEYIAKNYDISNFQGVKLVAVIGSFRNY